jgi:NAD(P)-dependent dehydrogenase (short-subunit alcohol dehydrogenase family)
MSAGRRRVLITGASSGLGRAAVDAFVADGADVALLSRSRHGLEVAAAAARAAGARAIVVPADIGDRTAVEHAVARAAHELGGLDVLVLCAAAMIHGPFTDVTPEAFDRTLAVTFTGAVDVIRAALPALEATAGVIVATGSTASTTPLPAFSSYAAAKHALRGFLRSLRIELQAQGSTVAVCQVHPGAMGTPLWDHTPSTTGRRARRPPLPYSPSSVAAELVAASHHRRPETTVGAEATLERVLLGLPGRPADLALRALNRFYSGAHRRAVPPAALWEPMGRGAARGETPFARPSLTAPLRRFFAAHRPTRRTSP